jgi:hypothetical protein
MRDARSAAGGAAGFAAFTAIAFCAAPVVAQEYCVACTGPNALYRCVLEEVRPSGIPLKSLCVKTLAREGRHVTCSIRSGTVFDCDAPIKRIDAVSAAEKIRASPAPQSQQNTAPAPSPTVIVTPGAPSEVAQPAQVETTRPRPPEKPEHASSDGRKPPSGNPGTVEGLAKSISRSSKNSLNRAGEAIENTTRKTWNCLASFFKSC